MKGDSATPSPETPEAKVAGDDRVGVPGKSHAEAMPTRPDRPRRRSFGTSWAGVTLAELVESLSRPTDSTVPTATPGNLVAGESAAGQSRRGTVA